MSKSLEKPVQITPDSAVEPTRNPKDTSLLRRLFPPLTPAQADVMARVKYPCC